MAKTANVMTRIDPTIKEQAEKVFERLGLSMSSGIEVYLVQVAMQRKIPFELKAMIPPPIAKKDLTKEQFDNLMEKSFEEYERGEGSPVEEGFAKIERKYGE